MKEIPTHKGYVRIRLFKENKGKFISIHKMVADAFLGPCPERFQINHKDTNKANNRACNLEYVSASENMRHAARAGKSGPAKLNCKDVREIRRLLKSGLKQTEIANRFGVSSALISGINCGKIWGHFEFAGVQPIAATRKKHP